MMSHSSGVTVAAAACSSVSLPCRSRISSRAREVVGRWATADAPERCGTKGSRESFGGQASVAVSALGSVCSRVNQRDELLLLLGCERRRRGEGEEHAEHDSTPASRPAPRPRGPTSAHRRKSLFQVMSRRTSLPGRGAHFYSRPTPPLACGEASGGVGTPPLACGEASGGVGPPP